MHMKRTECLTGMLEVDCWPIWLKTTYSQMWHLVKFRFWKLQLQTVNFVTKGKSVPWLDGCISVWNVEYNSIKYIVYLYYFHLGAFYFIFLLARSFALPFTQSFKYEKEFRILTYKIEDLGLVIVFLLYCLDMYIKVMQVNKTEDFGVLELN